MEEYYFLFGLALVWTVFAVVQDFRRREVSNWLNFSFIAIALAYRAFYSVARGDMEFFVLGLGGFAVFFVIAHGLYYSRVFAGGDAKLLMGYGVILPYTSYSSLFFLGVGFIFVLFLVGAIYSLIYGLFLVVGNWERFKKEFVKDFSKRKWMFVVSVVLGIGFLFLVDKLLWLFLVLFLLVMPLMYSYLKALDKSMIKLKSWGELQEGDWLEKDVKIGGRVIKKSVHGLSLKEIVRIKKSGRRVLIKDGIPFTPAFLGALGIMVYVFLVLEVSAFLAFLF